MTRQIAAVMREYGSTLLLRHGGSEQTVRAFLQPVTDKTRQNMNALVRELGQLPKGQYLYLGPADAALAVADELQCDNEVYLVRRTETLLLADAPLYIWALCVRKGRDEPWNS